MGRVVDVTRRHLAWDELAPIDRACVAYAVAGGRISAVDAAAVALAGTGDVDELARELARYIDPVTAQLVPDADARARGQWRSFVARGAADFVTGKSDRAISHAIGQARAWWARLWMNETDK